MYWTRYGGSDGTTVRKGGMDGSNPTNLVAGSGWANGIQIDFTTRRLYWADRDNKRIQSSNLYGGDVRTIVDQLPAFPSGIALVDDRLYWGSWGSYRIESMSIQNRSDQRVEHTERSAPHHLTVPLRNLPPNRRNHCEGRVCSGVCVLTPSSYTCVSS